MVFNVIVVLFGELGVGDCKFVFVNGCSIVLFNIEGWFYVVDNSCLYNGVLLVLGCLDGNVLQCLVYGLCFDFVIGCMFGVGGLCLKIYVIYEIDGYIVIQLEDVD